MKRTGRQALTTRTDSTGWADDGRRSPDRSGTLPPRIRRFVLGAAR